MARTTSPHEKTLIDYVRPYAGSLAVGLVLLLLTNVAEKAIPWLLKIGLDALQGGSYERVSRAALAVVGLALVMWVVRTASRVWIFNVGRDVEYDVRTDLLARVHALGPSFFGRMPTGEIMSRATSDVGQVRLLVGFAGMNVVNSAIAFLTAFSLMMTISVKLTLFSLAPYPFLILFTRWFGAAIFTRSARSQAALAALSDRANESIAGVRVVRSMGLAERERQRFDAVNQRAVKASMALVTLRGMMWPALMSVSSIGVLIALGLGGSMILEGELTVGEYAAFDAYLALLIWPTLAFGYVLSVVQRGRASFERIRHILLAKPEVDEPESPPPLTKRGALKVEGLSFSYRDALGASAEKVLDNVRFEVPAGGSLAVIGPTGSGKSTLAALLPRLLPTPAGSVYLDGQDVTTLSLRDLRKTVGYAQQEPFLFSTTIERNLGFGLEDPEVPDAEARLSNAAREAVVLDDIEAMPDHFETVVGERGVQLSGGQKQRIALARALLNEPTVLVLDDPLSAVDADTEKRILEALERAKENRTLVLITNRVAAAARADAIVVLEAGRIVERGTHEALVQAGGLYADIAAKQRLEAELEEM